MAQGRERQTSTIRPLLAGAALAALGAPASAQALPPSALTAPPLSLAEPSPSAEPAPSSEQPDPGTPPPAGEKQAYLDPDYPRPWTVQIEPLVWFLAASGKVRLPVTSGTGPGNFTTEGDEVDVSDLDLSTTRLRPAGEIHINADLWRFTFSGTDASLSQRGHTSSDTFRIGAVEVAPGDTLDAEYDLFTFEFTLGYQIWARDFQKIAKDPENTVPIILRVYAIGGARVYDVQFDVQRTSGTPARATSSEFFGEPIVGFRAEADFTRRFAIDLQFTGGGQPFGSHTSYSFDVAASFHWRPIDNVAIQIGYRQLLFSLSDGEDVDEFSWDGRLAGLFLGLTIRF